ncbi:hypothetical protein IW261DRAFT_1562537 [Armillaria novae-zelandiae]|uniref:F-box domain-containing protein n=1 Tax=Armillaria novae-zelandiae TaxID=153914 RepID=A0AA39U9L9_9AGAR|nr:hypothetical protein IW261DRAFT_1562537 [Armillaria novae-zelandiae]
MTTLITQLVPVFRQIEGPNIVHCSQQTKLAATKADQGCFVQGIHGCEQTNEFITSLPSPEQSPASVTPLALNPILSIQSPVSTASKSRTALMRLPGNVQQCAYFPYQLSPELIMEIFAWCSPYDLLLLQRISRYIKAILDSNGRFCWTRARHNLAQMPPPPFRSEYSSWNVCEASFTKFCFSSGRAPCFCCGRAVENSLPHLIYRIYVCSRRTCRGSLVLEHQFYIFSDDPQDPLYEKYKAIIPLLSYYLSPEKQKLFLVNHAKKELAWYHTFNDTGNEAILNEKMEEKIELRRVLGTHAVSVLKWFVKYGLEVKDIKRKNRRFLKATMKKERLNCRIALTTPTIRRTLRVFNLRLTCITVTVWLEIKNQVLKEYIA